MIIEVKNLKKTYEGKVPTHALKNINFGVKKGEFVALMGRSGSGKSTLLHQLGLLDIPSSGEVIMDGINLMSFTEKQKSDFRLEKLGYVFQSYALLPELTALESVYLPLMLSNVAKKDYIKKASEMLDKVGLGDRLHHLPKEMSGGEQQRVAIARALINDPIILFADEPTANLDTESSMAILKLFRELNKKIGQTIIMVTHEPDDKKYVDRVIWLKDGVIQDE
ncbi:MAG: ABC transporter ATP-binding protein [Patescibacteria group bacterium]|jgi:putative ABC transport system ATP-binding protein|nr:ABC transporter ATP-binding protein [Patescibacteria group bacterium]